MEDAFMYADMGGMPIPGAAAPRGGTHAAAGAGAADVGAGVGGHKWLAVGICEIGADCAAPGGIDGAGITALGVCIGRLEGVCTVDRPWLRSAPGGMLAAVGPGVTGSNPDCTPMPGMPASDATPVELARADTDSSDSTSPLDGRTCGSSGVAPSCS